MTGAARRQARLVLRFRLPEMRACCEAQLALLHAQFLVWRRPIGRLIDRVATPSVTMPARGDRQHEIRLLTQAIDRAARRGIFRPQCLAKALGLHLMLERRGIPGSVVRIGVRTQGDELLAHAWVELHGMALLEGPVAFAGFTPLADARLAESTNTQS